MKFRSPHAKTKLQHHVIPGLRDVLAQLEPWPEISGIIPGRIQPTRGSSLPLRLTIQYETKSGLKVLAKSSASVQEVFFISSYPQLLAKRLATLDIVRMKTKPDAAR